MPAHHNPREGRAVATAIWRGLAAGCVGLSLSAMSRAQTPSQTVTGPSQTTQVPLSGRDVRTGTVMVQQQTTPTAGSNGSVDILQNNVTIQYAYGGSTPNGTATGADMPLTLDQALHMGLRFNLAALTETATVMQAEGQRRVAKSDLLPNLNTGLTEEFEQINLRTLGVLTNEFPLTARFNFFDARAARLQQVVLDITKLDNFHGATANFQASVQAAKNARDLVVLAVGGAYLQLLETEARVQAAAAQVRSSEALAKQAKDRFDAGLAARIDASRSQVQQQSEQQRLRSLQADFDNQRLRLARIIGLPLGQAFTLSDSYAFSPQTTFTLDSALQQAFKTRSDLSAAASGVHAADEELKAAHAERLPRLNINADFGAAGLTPSHEVGGVFTVAGTLSIPLYEGGRIRGDVEQAEAAVKQRRAELEDTRGQIDQDVRQAFINLNAAADQVNIARSNVDLAHQTLAQSSDRFAAGITDTVEVVQAEQAVVQADDDYITAVFQHNLAKVALARAMGNAEQTLPQLLRK